MYARFGKRLFDLVIVCWLILLFLPIFIIIGVCSLLTLGWPIVFTQPRIGYGERIFKIYKLRTMTCAVDVHGHLLPDEQRVTKFGKLLRATSLDELPQLLNILLGHMSLVGPRPQLAAFLPHYNREQRLRHTVLPGITGWAQINGRNSISWSEKFTYDVWYVKNCSFWLDVKIIAITIWKVLKREHINANPVSIGMERFRQVPATIEDE